MELKQTIDTLVAQLPIINEGRNYWLVRTQSGRYYDSFHEHNYIAIGYDEISYSLVHQLKEKYNNDTSGFFTALKAVVVQKYPDEGSPGLIASQISRFIYEIKKGDIVMIPSYNSKRIAFGVVTETPLMEVTDTIVAITGCPYILRKSISWKKEVSRDELDPYLYRMFQAHQAINEVSYYSEIIERTLNNFFVKDGEAHLVLEVETQGEIHAKALFGLGISYLDLLDAVSKEFNLSVTSNDIEVKITLNSPGRLHFKAPKWSTIVIFGLCILAVNGGGMKFKEFDLSTPGILKSISDFLNQQHDRNTQDLLIKEYKDSLQVKDPDDLLNLLQQAATNKNNPK